MISLRSYMAAQCACFGPGNMALAKLKVEHGPKKTELNDKICFTVLCNHVA